VGTLNGLSSAGTLGSAIQDLPPGKWEKTNPIDGGCCLPQPEHERFS